MEKIIQPQSREGRGKGKRGKAKGRAWNALWRMRRGFGVFLMD
jgi:hypothetical protein